MCDTAESLLACVDIEGLVFKQRAVNDRQMSSENGMCRLDRRTVTRTSCHV